MVVAIWLKPMRPARKASTATSSAAFRTVPRFPPASAAARTVSYAGKAPGASGSKARLPHSAGTVVRATEGSRSGNVSAYWIGRRMSGCPSCALYEPSVNSTSECTTLWGWITASILEYGSRYNHLASMTSNALLTRVAESIVIFGPIRQVGWASASSTVRAFVRSAGARNGPPLAVRTRRATDPVPRPGTARSPSARCRPGEAARARRRPARRAAPLPGDPR